MVLWNAMKIQDSKIHTLLLNNMRPNNVYIFQRGKTIDAFSLQVDECYTTVTVMGFKLIPRMCILKVLLKAVGVCLDDFGHMH